MELDIEIYNTIPKLVLAWNTSKEEIIQAYSLMTAAKTRLQTTFEDNHRFDVGYEPGTGWTHYDQPEKKIDRLKKEVWRSLIERLEIRRVLSVKRAKELDDCLEKGIMEDGKPLPDITEESILGMLKSFAENVDTFMEAAVKEVFDFLRPPRSQYKTNTEFEIGKRVVLSRWITQGYGANPFSTNYSYDAEIRALDNVFHLLDGKGIAKSHFGPLQDAIKNSPDGRGETDYFRFKCYHNNNFHLEFKRMDLVRKLNAIAGGMNLRQAAQAA